MPTLRIVSVYEERQRMYADQLAQARAELEEFKMGLATRFIEQEARAIRQQVHWTEDTLFGRVKVMNLSEEGIDAVETLRMLRKKVVAVLRKIRTADCWFHEEPVPISVPGDGGADVGGG